MPMKATWSLDGEKVREELLFNYYCIVCGGIQHRNNVGAEYYEYCSECGSPNPVLFVRSKADLLRIMDDRRSKLLQRMCVLTGVPLEVAVQPEFSARIEAFIKMNKW